MRYKLLGKVDYDISVKRNYLFFMAINLLVALASIIYYFESTDATAGKENFSRTDETGWGPTALKTISILPACFITRSRYAITAFSFNASTSTVSAFPLKGRISLTTS
jgi:hypothetical protein